jgi:hypothetical protein
MTCVPSDENHHDTVPGDGRAVLKAGDRLLGLRHRQEAVQLAHGPLRPCPSGQAWSDPRREELVCLLLDLSDFDDAPITPGAAVSPMHDKPWIPLQHRSQLLQHLVVSRFSLVLGLGGHGDGRVLFLACCSGMSPDHGALQWGPRWSCRLATSRLWVAFPAAHPVTQSWCRW